VASYWTGWEPWRQVGTGSGADGPKMSATLLPFASMERL